MSPIVYFHTDSCRDMACDSGCLYEPTDAAGDYRTRVQLALSILGHRETTDGLSRDDCLLVRAALEGRDVLGGAA